MLLVNDFVLENMLVMHLQAAKQHLPEGPANFWNLQFPKCSKLSPEQKSLTKVVSQIPILK
jgi:hypothetical protein